MELFYVCIQVNLALHLPNVFHLSIMFVYGNVLSSLPEAALTSVKSEQHAYVR